MTIGLKVRQLRRDNNLSQTELGKLLGVKPQAVAAYEKEVTPLSLDKLEILAKRFEVSIDYFLSNIEIDKVKENGKNPITKESFDHELIEELRSTMDFLKKQNEQLTNMLEMAIKGGNFPEGSTNNSTGEKEIKTLGYTSLKLAM